MAEGTGKNEEVVAAVAEVHRVAGTWQRVFGTWCCKGIDDVIEAHINYILSSYFLVII